MTGYFDHRLRSIGIIVLAVVTLGVFKSVYRRLYSPFKQVFLCLLSAVYALLLSVTVLFVVARQLQQIGQQFPDLAPVLRSKELGLGLFGLIFVVFYLSVISLLGWYFEQRTMIERLGDGGNLLAETASQSMKSCKEGLQKIASTQLFVKPKSVPKKRWFLW